MSPILVPGDVYGVPPSPPCTDCVYKYMDIDYTLRIVGISGVFFPSIISLLF